MTISLTLLFKKTSLKASIRLTNAAVINRSYSCPIATRQQSGLPIRGGVAQLVRAAES